MDIESVKKTYTIVLMDSEVKHLVEVLKIAIDCQAVLCLITEEQEETVTEFIEVFGNTK